MASRPFVVLSWCVIGVLLTLGGIWDPLGAIWELSWALLGLSWGRPWGSGWALLEVLALLEQSVKEGGVEVLDNAPLSPLPPPSEP